MASPILPQRTYRLSQIPGCTTKEDVRQIFPLEVREKIQFLSLASAVDCEAPDKQVCTITFSSELPSLQSLPFKTGSLLSTFFDGAKTSQIWIDEHFHGFTALNDPTDEHEVVDIIAVTGLGGKPFASWQCYDGSMWLRDHVPSDVPNLRVSIYGYFSDVGDSDSISTLSELAEMFVLDLLEYRRMGVSGRKCPLVLIGHSTGGLIIKDAWCRIAECKSPCLDSLHQSIAGLVFFGTPHNGMPAARTLQRITGQPSKNLVRDIEPGATYIKALKNGFSRATSGPNIISCYELRQTPQTVRHPDGTLNRSGTNAMNVSEDSACLYWANEVRLPINENHSMIAKLAKRDGSAYRVVVNSLSRLVTIARQKVPPNLTHACATNFENRSTQREPFTNALQNLALYAIPKWEAHVQSDDSTAGQGHHGEHVSSHQELQERPAMLTVTPDLECKQAPADSGVRVYVQGTWNAYNHGHVRFLKLAKQAFPNTHLVAGVVGDPATRKATDTSVAERAEVVRSCKYVDEVIEDCPAVLDPELLARLRIEYLGCGEHSSSEASLIPSMHLDLQGKTIIIPRTHTIHSSGVVAAATSDPDIVAESRLNLV